MQTFFRQLVPCVLFPFGKNTFDNDHPVTQLKMLSCDKAGGYMLNNQ